MQDTGFIPNSTATGDFNGDGKLDWATAMAGDNTVWVYLGNGDGTWQMPEIVPLKGGGPIAIVAADLRNTGKADLVVAEADSASVGVLLSNGDGTFQPEAEYPLPTSPQSLITGDFNGDGRQDVVVGNFGDAGIGPVSFLAGDGSGHLGSAIHSNSGTMYAGALALAAGDFNHDGKLDLMITGEPDRPYFDGVGVALGVGDGTFTVGQVLHQDGPFTLVAVTAVGDVDHDGCLDAVAFDAAGVSFYYKGNCDGTFQVTNAPSTPLGDSIVAGALVDVDGDGNLDIVGGGASVFAPQPLYGANAGNLVIVAKGDGKGGFGTAATVYRVAENLFGFAAADLHNTGRSDLIAPSMFESTIAVLENDGHGHFNAPSGSALAYPGTDNSSADNPQDTPVSAPAVLDLNGDGRPDIAVMRAQQSSTGPFDLTVLPLQADGSYGVPLHSNFVPNVGEITYPYVYAFGDFRGKGAEDAISLSELESEPFLYFAPNDGTGRFGNGTLTTPSAANGQVATGDFNGDGRLDFVAAGTANGYPALTVFLGNGDGTFTPQTVVNLTAVNGVPGIAFAAGVFAGDFNRDGRLDVLAQYWSNGMPYQLFEAFGDGKGGFTSAHQILPSVPYISVADLNHDGCPDLIAGDSATSIPGFSVYLCQPDGSFSGPQNYTPFQDTPETNPSIVSVFTPTQPFLGLTRAPLLGDFDGDGKTDVALIEQEGFQGESEILFATGNGDGTFTPHLLRTPLSAQFAPEYNGDLRGAGITGLLQLDKLTAAITAIPGLAAHASFAIQFRALPVSGGTGHLRLLLDQPAPQAESFTLSASDSRIGVPTQVTVPAGATSYDIDFAVGGGVDYTHAFTVTASQGAESHQVLGYAANQSVAAIEITPAFVDFGQVDVGVQSAPQTVTIKNFGSGPLTNLDMPLNPSQFSQQSSTCGTQLDAGASCTVQISLSADGTGSGPRVSGHFVAKGDQGSASIAMFGYQILIQTTLLVSPATLNFTAGIGQTTAPQTIKITNTGGSPLAFSEIQTPGAPFQQTANSCTAPVPPQQTCQLSYTYTGQQPSQSLTATYPLSLYGDFNGDAGFTLNGVVASGQIQASPTSLDFGSVPIGTTSSSQVVTFTNTSSDPLYIRDILQTPGVTGTTTCNSITLGSHQTCIVTTSVFPTVPGALTGSLTVESTATNDQSLVIPVSANLSLSLKLAPGASSSVTISSGQSAQEAVSVNETSSAKVTLTCTSPTLSCGVSPSSMSGPVSNSVATVTISATSIKASLADGRSPHVWFAILFPLVCLVWPRRRPLVRGVALLAIAFLITSCGGGGNGSKQGAPTGSYSVVLTANDGTSTATQNFTVTVQ